MDEYQQVLSAINKTDGYSNLYEFGCKLAALTKHMQHDRGHLLQLPNLLVETKAGIVSNEFIGLLAKLTTTLGIKTLIGEESVVIEKYADDEKCLENLVQKLHQAAGFYGEFTGFVALQMSPETDPASLKYLFQLVETQPNMTFVFFVPTSFGRRKRFVSELMRRTSLYQMKVDSVGTKQLVQHLENRLALKGFSVDAQARQTLFTVLDELKDTACFDDYRTAEHLAEYIAWHFVETAMNRKTTVISNLQFLLEREGFVSSFQETTATRSIGFSEKG